MAAETAQPGEKPRLERWLEALLDPRTIHYLLGLGGALCVLGVIVWLASLGIFENALVLAGSLIAGNAAVLTFGVLLALRTGYKTTGNAVAFLACVLAPLNLWFLHAQHLMTIADHLWIGGVVCSLVFAAVVRLLQQPMHVYAVEIGVTLTALLFLADLHRAADPVFLAIACTTLAAASLQIINAFPAEGAFSRHRFFAPLFVSGQVQLAAGLVVLAASQLLGGWPVLGRYGLEWLGGGFDRSPWLSALVWSVGGVLYLVSHRHVPTGRVFASAAIVCAVFAAMSIVNPYLGVDGRIIAYAVCSAVFAVRVREENGERSLRELGIAGSLALGMLASAALILRANGFHWYAGLPISWPLLAAAAATATSQFFAARKVQDDSRTAMVVQSLLAGAAMSTAVVVARHLYFPAISTFAMLGAVMAIPATIAAAAGLVASNQWKRPLFIASLFAGTIAVASGLQGPGVVEALLRPSLGRAGTPYLALIAAQFAFITGAALAVRKQPALISACGFSLVVTLWLSLGLMGVPGVYFAAVLAVFGLAKIVLGQRVLQAQAFASSFVVIGRSLLVLAGLAALFQTIPYAFDAGPWTDLSSFALVAFVCAAAGLVDAEKDWRGVFRVFAVAVAIGVLFDVNAMFVLPTWRKAEFISTVLGLLAVAIAYSEAFAGRDRRDAPGYLSLATLLAAGPVLIGALYFRFAEGRPSLPEEFATLTAAILLSATGLAWRFRAPTIIGLGSLAVYLAVMIGQLAYHPQVAVGVYLAVGGGLLFVIAAILAAYREWLLALPDAIERRQGIFQVLDWR